MTLYTPHEYNAFRQVHTPAAYASGVAWDGLWISMVEHRSVTFVASNGELDANMPLIVREATDSNGSGAQTLTGVAGTFTNGTDEARLGLLTVWDHQMSAGFTHLTVRVTPGAADTFSCIAVLSNPNKLPASNAVGSTDGIAFNDTI